MVGKLSRARPATAVLPLALLAASLFAPVASRADGLAGYQLPWRLSVAHKVGGSWYGEGRHTGADAYALDFNLKYEPVLAVQSGTVVKAVSAYPDPGGQACYAQSSAGYGNYVVVSHAGGYTSVYGHLSRVVVTAGTPVTQGQQIGVSGNTGRSCGAHLHFSLRKSGRAYRPEPIGGYTSIRHDHARAYLSKNADTLTDLLLSDGAAGGQVLFADAAGGWRLGAPFPLTGSRQITPGRFNKDRPADVFVYDGVGQGQVMFADGSGGWRSAPVASFAGGWQVTPGTFNPDTVTDLFLYNPTSGYAQVALADGAGGWTQAALQTLAAGRTVVVGSFDANPPADVLLYDASTGTADLYFGDGAGAWSAAPQRSLPAGATITTGRFNADALTDLALYGAGAIQVLFADGSGGWIPGAGAFVVASAQLFPGSFNRDALTDLFAYDSAGNGQVLFADGLGGWTAAPAAAVGPGWRVTPGLYNGDARTDLFLYAPGQPGLTPGTGQVLFATGSGSWTAGPVASSYPAGAGITPGSFGNGPL